MSDVCKHCVNAPCLEVCPTGSIVRTEFDTVYIQEPVCNGCRDCITACPFGVIHVSAEKHIAQKCTFCYDRLQNGLVPACAQACPTRSIQFGPIAELKQRAEERVRQLHGQGATRGLSLRGRHEDPRRSECVLPADGPARDLRAALRGEGAGAQPVGLAGVDQGDRGVADHRPRGVRLVRPEEAAGRRGGRAGELDRMNLELNTSVADPDWHGLIVWYFFLGGIAAGAYVMAALADLFGDAEDRPRRAGGLLHRLSAGRRLRAAADDRPGPARAVLAHADPVEHGLADVQVVVADVGRARGASRPSALFSFASFVGVLAEDGWLGLKRFSPLASRLRTGWTGRLFALGGSLAGVLPRLVHGRAAGREQPADLVEHHLDRGALPGLVGLDRDRRDGRCSIAGCGSASRRAVIEHLERLDSWAIVLELIMLAIMTVSLGRLAWDAFAHWPGILVPAFVVPVGLVFPLVLKRWPGTRAAVTASVFVLLGGFALRAAVVGMPLPLLASHH